MEEVLRKPAEVEKRSEVTRDEQWTLSPPKRTAGTYSVVKPAVGANNGNAQLENEILERMPPPFKSLVEFWRKTNQAVGETINQPQEQEVRTI